MPLPGTFVLLHAQSLSWVWFFATPWTLLACWATLCMRFSQQKYWNGLPFPSPGYLPDPRIEPSSPASSALQVDSSLLSHPALSTSSLNNYSTNSFAEHILWLVTYLLPYSSVSLQSWTSHLALDTFSWTSQEVEYSPSHVSMVCHRAADTSKIKTTRWFSRSFLAAKYFEKKKRRLWERMTGRGFIKSNCFPQINE